MLGRKRKLESVKFLVDKKPYALHGLNLKRDDDKYLENLDPAQWLEPLESFRNKAEISFNDATSLRIAVSQNVETILGLLFAVLQSPYNIRGWLTFYKVHDLKSLCMKVNESNSFDNHFSLKNTTWREISETLWKNLPEENVQNYSEALTSLVSFFMNDMNKDEYNALKHGLRVNKAPVELTFIDPLNNRVKSSLGGAKFGSSFMIAKKKSGPNYIVKESYINWDIDELKDLAGNIYITGHNLLWSLHQLRNIDSDIKPLVASLSRPCNETEKRVDALFSVIVEPDKHDSELKPEALYTNEEILSSYED